MIMANPVVWFEVLGKDGKALRRFYGDIFGWEFEAASGMDYGMTKKVGEQGIQGGVGSTMEGGPGWATFYVAVPDVKASLKLIEQKGGRVIVPYTEIPDMVTFAVFADPEGNPVGLVQDRGNP
jgi:predicted enzyme related to lactoylglutathione lyase